MTMNFQELEEDPIFLEPRDHLEPPDEAFEHLDQGDKISPEQIPKKGDVLPKEEEALPTAMTLSHEEKKESAMELDLVPEPMQVDTHDPETTGNLEFPERTHMDVQIIKNGIQSWWCGTVVNQK